MALGGGPHLPLGPRQQLSEVLPVSEGFQHGQEVPVANGHPESVGLGCGPARKPVFHVLGHDVIPARVPAEVNHHLRARAVSIQLTPGTTPQELRASFPPSMSWTPPDVWLPSPQTSGPGPSGDYGAGEAEFPARTPPFPPIWESPYMSLSAEGLGPPRAGSWASMISLKRVFPMFKASWGRGRVVGVRG